MTRKQNNRALTHISLVMTLNFRFCIRCRQVKDISEFFCASKTREPLQELHIDKRQKKLDKRKPQINDRVSWKALHHIFYER